MKYPVFAIRDVKASFMAPTIDINDRVAVRNFSRAINNGEGIMNFSPADFDLYLIGHYDDQTARLESLEVVQLVACGRDLVGAADV